MCIYKSAGHWENQNREKDIGTIDAKINAKVCKAASTEHNRFFLSWTGEV